jgi:hypothetical protein
LEEAWYKDGSTADEDREATIKLVRIEGIDPSKYADDDNFESKEVFQTVRTQRFGLNTIRVLKPFDIKQAEESQKAQNRKSNGPRADRREPTRVSKPLRN